jgi:hypothetical protein
VQIDIDDAFTYLVGGVAEASKTEFRYPYPSLFRQALNQLSVLQVIQRKTLPTEMQDLLALLEQPVGDWWPGQLPRTFIDQYGADSALLFDGQPESWVWDYLEKRGAKTLAPESLQFFQADIDQSAILEVMNICSKANPPLTDVYVTVRQFLIRNPWTTLSDLQQSLGSIPQLPMELINSFYETPATFSRLAKRDGSYWLCPCCNGILNWIDGEATPRCARHSVCGRRYPGYQGMQKLPERFDILRLKWGLHRRVCVPGLAELKLFEWLEDLKKQTPGLREVVLWPGVDLYDIQVTFQDAANTVWAIDVKDYDSPIQLAYKIREDKRFNAGSLSWKVWFYIVPQYRIQWNARYIAQCRSILNDPKNKICLPQNVKVVSEEVFRRHVSRQITALSSSNLP